MTRQLLDHDAIVEALDAVAALLADRQASHQTIIVVGGSYLALRGLRDSTLDVDTLTRIGSGLRQAAADVAAKRGLPTTWLNDSAARFAPEGLSEGDCSVMIERDALTVLGPSPDWVFIMKLNRGLTVDRADMVRLWPHCGFESPEEAVGRYRRAYPADPDDEYLVDYVREIAVSPR